MPIKYRFSFTILFVSLIFTFFNFNVLGQKQRSVKNSSVKNEITVKAINTVQLKDLMAKSFKQRKPLFVNVWASWCPYCRQELPELKAAHKKYGAKVDFLILSVDEPADLQSMASVIQSANLRLPLFWLDKSKQGTWMDEFAKQIPTLQEVLPATKESVPRALIYNANGKITYNNSGAMTFDQMDELLSEALSN